VTPSDATINKWVENAIRKANPKTMGIDNVAERTNGKRPPENAYLCYPSGYHQKTLNLGDALEKQGKTAWRHPLKAFPLFSFRNQSPCIAQDTLS